MGKGGRGGAPYEKELAGMFAAQNMLNMAARNPNAATLFRPGSELGDSYGKLFGTHNLPAKQEFNLPDIGIASDAMRRVYGSDNVPRTFGAGIQSKGFMPTPSGLTMPPQGTGKQGGQGGPVKRRNMAGGMS